MATRDTGHTASGITRRDFLKAAAATTAVAGCGLDFAFNAEKAAAYEGNSDYTVTFTTCPYCSASCGQRVVKDNATNEIVDLYGDFESPMNSGGLCSKGAGSLQLVNNERRLGAWPGSHPEDPAFAARAETGDGLGGISDFTNGVAYMRTGNGNWSQVGMDYAMGLAAQRLMTARESDTAGWDPAALKYNTKGVAFFGSSHMNNESNYIYRKLIANFGSSNVEHQARI